MTALNDAYDKNLSFLHDHIKTQAPAILPKPKKLSMSFPEKSVPVYQAVRIAEVVRRAKAAEADALQKVKDVITVEEVSV